MTDSIQAALEAIKAVDYDIYKELKDDLEHCEDPACRDSDTLEAASNVIKNFAKAQVIAFAESIVHGDFDHQQWLKEAASKWVVV